MLVLTIFDIQIVGKNDQEFNGFLAVSHRSSSLDYFTPLMKPAPENWRVLTRMHKHTCRSENVHICPGDRI